MYINLFLSSSCCVRYRC